MSSRYQLQKDENQATFYKLEPHSIISIPQVSETIVVDKMLHVKLFSFASPIPLPEWFRKGSDCCLKKKSMLENFPSYIRNFIDMKKLPDDILSELELIRYKKPVDRPKYSVNMLRYALLLRYTSVQAYKLLLQQFPLPSLSLLKKLTEGGIEPLKAAKVLLEQGDIGTDVVLLLDEVYLQKDSQYQDGELVGADNEGNLYKGVMTFMINSLKKSIPLVVKAIPEIKIEGKWLSEHIDNCITSLSSVGFNVCAVISDNHSTNVSAFKYLFNMYGNEQKGENIITHPSNPANRIYLFFDPVHLLKNIRNNLFNSQRFIFPSFKFDEFFDPIDVPSGEISWKLLHEIYDKDDKLPANL